MTGTPAQENPQPQHMFRGLRRLEAAAFCVIGLVIFAGTGTSWWLGAFLFFAPDGFMLGYLINARAGAFVYNIGHSYLAPLLLALPGLGFGEPVCVALAALWLAHIGFDRALGYGLKYPTGFTDTHLSA